jgi:hypothetical protein
MPTIASVATTSPIPNLKKKMTQMAPSSISVGAMLNRMK